MPGHTRPARKNGTRAVGDAMENTPDETRFMVCRARPVAGRRVGAQLRHATFQGLGLGRVAMKASILSQQASRAPVACAFIEFGNGFKPSEGGGRHGFSRQPAGFPIQTKF